MIVDDKMYRLNHSSGLPDNSIMSILEDKYHTVWVGTKNGLLNIVPNRDTDNNYTSIGIAMMRMRAFKDVCLM